MNEFEKELKRIKEEGKLQTVSAHHYSGKKSHKQNVPLTAKKWSLEKKIREYELVLSYLRKYVKWIEEHKITKPEEWYAVIQHIEAWKKSYEILIKWDNQELKKV